MQAVEPQAGEELERMLARYARVRLDPSPAQVRRARAVIMEDVRRQHLAAPVVPAAAPARRRPFAGWGPRRLGMTLVAAGLAGLLVGSTTFAASRAGGPLYDARLAIEAAAMPAGGGARLEAEIAQAQARLAEVVDASSRGDQGALVASLAAYEASIARLQDESGAAAIRALEAIQAHRIVLLGVLANVPASADDGLGRAIANSDRVIERLQAVNNGPAGGNGQGGDDGQGGGTNGTPKPDKTAGPDATPKPQATLRPDRTPRPEVTPKPDKTPRPHPTPNPGGPAASAGTESGPGTETGADTKSTPHP